MNQAPKNDGERPNKKVHRYSPNRLLRETVTVPSKSAISTEKYRGRIMIRVESPEGEN
jgi:hypothetical protein